MNNLKIRILVGVKEQNFAREIFDDVWPSDEGSQITANLIQAMVHNGTYVAGAVSYTHLTLPTIYSV